VAGRVLRSPSGPVKSLVIRRSLAGGIGEAQRGDVLSRQFRRRWICGNAGERARIPHDLTHPGTGGRGGAGMSEIQFTYALDFVSRRRHTDPRPAPEAGETVLVPIPRIARLLALAIRLQELVRKQKIRDYAEAAHLGRVTRARMDPDHEAARSGARYSGADSVSAADGGAQRKGPPADCQLRELGRAKAPVS
jgi:hypothetical protein